MVRVVFSDGSKADAHNLDDLRERWILRRQEEARAEGTTWLRPTEPEYIEPSSLEQGREYRAILKNICGQNQGRLTELNALTYRSPNWKVRKAAIVAELEYRRCQLRMLNATMISLSEAETKQSQADKFTNLPDFVRELMNHMGDMNAEIKLLKKRVDELERGNR